MTEPVTGPEDHKAPVSGAIAWSEAHEHRPAGRISSLDGWRAVGVILVLGSHFPYTSNFPVEARGAVKAAFDGDLGVRIFFVLSGFLISTLLIREGRKNGRVSLKHFYIRRTLRIWPVYFAYVGVLGLFSLAGSYSDSPSSWLGSATFTRNVVGRGNSATVHLWSLAVEEQFYFCWPAVMVLSSLWRKPRVAMALLIGTAAVCAVIRCSIPPQVGGDLTSRLLGSRSAVMYGDSLLMGCIGAFLSTLRAPPRWCDDPRFQVLAIASIAGLRWKQVHGLQAATVEGLVPTFQAVLVFLLIWGSAYGRVTWLHRALNGRCMVFIGTLSYGIYMWQFLFLSHFFPVYKDALMWDWRVWFVPTLVVSIASYVLIERPALRLKDSLGSVSLRSRPHVVSRCLPRENTS